MSFVHTRNLTHCCFPGQALLGDTDIKAQRKGGVNYAMCKNPSMYKLNNVVETRKVIYRFDRKEKNSR